jgi:hypothetical protein
VEVSGRCDRMVLRVPVDIVGIGIHFGHCCCCCCRGSWLILTDCITLRGSWRSVCLSCASVGQEVAAISSLLASVALQRRAPTWWSRRGTSRGKRPGSVERQPVGFEAIYLLVSPVYFLITLTTLKKRYEAEGTLHCLALHPDRAPLLPCRSYHVLRGPASPSLKTSEWPSIVAMIAQIAAQLGG